MDERMKLKAVAAALAALCVSAIGGGLALAESTPTPKMPRNETALVVESMNASPVEDAEAPKAPVKVETTLEDTDEDDDAVEETVEDATDELAEDVGGFEAVIEESVCYKPAPEEPAWDAESALEADASWTETPPEASGVDGSITSLRSAGVAYDGGTRYTWYSENVLPGGGLTALNSNGRTVDSATGVVVDGDGYIAVASSDYAQGTVLETPWGAAKVYDSGCASGTVDVYVSW